jgi:hypothetical protein
LRDYILVTARRSTSGQRRKVEEARLVVQQALGDAARRAGPYSTLSVSGANDEYDEGDWFSVPLRDGGFGLGVVARVNREGVLFGYFFGPRRSKVPTLRETTSVQPRDAVLTARFGHLGLRGGTWPIVGRSKAWKRDDWPMPEFRRYEELTGRTFKVTYDKDDPNRVIREEQTSPQLVERLSKDSLFGAGAVEIALTRLLAPLN